MIHFALLKKNVSDWCQFHDPLGVKTYDASKVTCWHCLGWMNFGPGKDIELEDVK